MTDQPDTTPPSVEAHLPPSLKCRDCQQHLAFLLKNGEVKNYCEAMHLISYTSAEPQQLITDCSGYLKQE